MPKLLITRPAYSFEKSAHDFKKLGFEILHAPMLRIEAIDFDPVDTNDFGGFIFSSQHAVRLFAKTHIGDGKIKQPAFCVGTTTADAAYRCGFTNVHNAGRDADALIEMIAGIYKNHQLPLLYVRGEDISTELKNVEALKAIKIKERIVYGAQKSTHFPDDVMAALQNEEIDMVTFYSVRTAENFRTLIQKNGLEQQIARTKSLCISAGVLEYVSDLKWSETYVSEQPDHKHMIEKAREIISSL